MKVKKARIAQNFYLSSKVRNMAAKEGLPHTECFKQCNQIWKNMSEHEKWPYVEMSLQDRVRFNKEIDEAKNAKIKGRSD